MLAPASPGAPEAGSGHLISRSEEGVAAWRQSRLALAGAARKTGPVVGPPLYRAPRLNRPGPSPPVGNLPTGGTLLPDSLADPAFLAGLAAGAGLFTD